MARIKGRSYQTYQNTLRKLVKYYKHLFKSSLTFKTKYPTFQSFQETIKIKESTGQK